MTPLFRRALGAAWADLDAEVRALHSVDTVAVWEGAAEVARGRGPMAWLASRLAGFPPAGQGVAVRLTMTRAGDSEVWERAFGGHAMRTTCRPGPVPGRTRETLGRVTLEMALRVRDGALSMQVVRGWLGWLPLPRRLLPVSETREYGEGGRYRFEVAARAPLTGGLIVRYRGWLSRRD